RCAANNRSHALSCRSFTASVLSHAGAKVDMDSRVAVGRHAGIGTNMYLRPNCTSIPICTPDVRDEAGPMTEFELPNVSQLKPLQQAKPGRTTQCDHRCDGASILYIDHPTIPVGMTVETYRRARAHGKAHAIRRIASPVLWRDR